MAEMEINKNVDEIMTKANTLIEALPYIRRFNGATIIVKYGGSAIDVYKRQGLLNEGKEWHPSFLLQMILGSLIIISYEYLTGVIVNIYLKLHVWDYSKVPFNYRGQICIPFLIIWFFVTPLCIWMDDVIREALFKF